MRRTGGTTPQITVITGQLPTGTPPPPAAPTSTADDAPRPPHPPTGAPSNLRKTGQTASTITLGWTGPATASYDILRGEDGDKIATVTGTTFTDIGLLPSTPYVYSVRGTGGTSPQITVTLN